MQLTSIGRRLCLIGIMVLLMLGVAQAQSPGIGVYPDGSLALTETAALVYNSNSSLPDATHELESSQVQIYIFRNSSRGWSPPPFFATGKTKRGVGQVSRSHRARRLDPLIKKFASLHGVDQNLVRAVMRQESGFNPQAVSPKGAMGLMQLMPGTAAMLGVKDPFDVAQNISGGVRYLKRCLRQFNQDIYLALAAYNAGPQNVEKYHGCPPFAETRNYVASVVREYTGNQRGQGGRITPKFCLASSPRSAPPSRSSCRRRLYRRSHGIPVVVSYSESGHSKIIQVISRRTGKEK